MSRVALLALLVVPLVACGGKLEVPNDDRSDSGASDTGASDSGGSTDGGSIDGGSIDGGGAACTPAECGPAPGAPSELCWDGSVAGANCVRLATGSCGWVFSSCPPERSCSVKEPCGDDKLFCKLPSGGCYKSGTCALKPTACPKNYDPVCGCDLVTYGNECMAQRANVGVMGFGPCDAPPPPPPTGVCGGFGGTSCKSNEWCDYAATGTSACGADDSGGTCKSRPTACPDLWAPVCACDHTTYGNECDAHMNGQDVWYTGECK